MQNPQWDIAVVGGAGHVGAPLAILLASRGFRTLIHDIDARAMERLAAGHLPFFEDGGDAMLAEVLRAGTLGFSPDVASVRGAPVVVITIGTPIDEFSNPKLGDLTACVDRLLPHLDDAQTLLLRSTVFPGVTDFLQRYLRAHGRATRIAFCPERVVQGLSIRELQALPQIVSGTTPEAEAEAARVFGSFAPKIVRMTATEAEFAKLFTNAYRYLQFAVSNQFYMMASSAGADYGTILAGMKDSYPRMQSLPGAGFAAGPCLYKDTHQLVTFAQQQFAIGQAAIQANEGLPAFVVEQLAARFDLPAATVGLLGMAFKGDSDDPRASLSYKLKKLLRFNARAVLTTDPWVKGDADLLPLDEVAARSDVLVLCAPHSAYRELDFGGRPVLDVWNVLTRANVLRAAEKR